MPKTKLTLSQTEQQVPKLAKSATSAAYRRAIRIGSVVVYRNGELQKVEADGKYRVVKKLEPRVRISKGSTFEIKPESV